MTHSLVRKRRLGGRRIKGLAHGCSGCGWLVVVPSFVVAAKAHREHLAQLVRDAELERRVVERLREEEAEYA